MTKRRIVIVTRESKLALCQAEWVKQRLLFYHPDLNIQLLGMTTEADKQLAIPLTDIGGKGLFVKELEEALLRGVAHMAVHSMKDVPMELLPGLSLPVICEREDARDALIANDYQSLAELPHLATVGTSSLRRQTQLHALRGDLVIQPLRGNIHTRLKRLDSREYQAIILAAAGLKRLKMTERIKAYFPPDQILPAAGQGALGIECREDDDEIKSLIQPLQDFASDACITAERALCRYLEGGCQVPIGAYAHIENNQLILHGLVSNLDASCILRSHLTGEITLATTIGQTVAQSLKQQGADQILKSFHALLE